MNYKEMKYRVGERVQNKGNNILEKAMGSSAAPFVYALVDDAHEGLVKVVDKLEPAIAVVENRTKQVKLAWQRIRAGEAYQETVFESNHSRDHEIKV